MNTFIRWGKFNLVGAMGMVVQLASLAVKPLRGGPTIFAIGCGR